MTKCEEYYFNTKTEIEIILSDSAFLQHETQRWKSKDLILSYDANNLQLYFEYLYKNNQNNILLIGEAPGYKGCRITGIPFTSGELFTNSEIKILKI